MTRHETALGIGSPAAFPAVSRLYHMLQTKGLPPVYSGMDWLKGSTNKINIRAEIGEKGDKDNEEI